MALKGDVWVKRVSNCKFRMKFTVADPFVHRTPARVPFGLSFAEGDIAFLCPFAKGFLV